MQQRWISRAQSRIVDQRAQKEFGMSSLVLMENAGRGTADVMTRIGVTGPVLICCGKGNNAGDGFVLARHLDLRRLDVLVILAAGEPSLTGDALANMKILERSGVPIEPLGSTADPFESLERRARGAEWIVDALLGTGAQGRPRSPFDRVIAALNRLSGLKLAIDLPSGLDCDTGQAAEPTLRANHTCSFVAPKLGFRRPDSRQWTGEVHVVDIGAPRQLVEEVLRGAESNGTP
jgi:NAD(P)H-hydrate epimerase